MAIPNSTFRARPFQLELFEHAKKTNSILVCGTGTGKTFISILLIKEFSNFVRGAFTSGAERILFVVNTVPLVYQQAAAIEQHTDLTVGRYEGALGVDLWEKEKWMKELDKNEVLVMSAQIVVDLLLHEFLPLSKVRLLIFDECHHTTGNHPMKQIMSRYSKYKAQGLKVPHICGLTACVVHKVCKLHEVQKVMRELECSLDCALVTSRDQLAMSHFSTKPTEILLECAEVKQLPGYESITQKLDEIKRYFKEKLKTCHGNKKFQSMEHLITKLINNILQVSDDIGKFVLPKAILYLIEYLNDLEFETQQEKMIYLDLKERLREVHLKCAPFPRPDGFLSGKVMRLLELLKLCSPKNGKNKVFVIIFVTRRNTAKILSSLLKELARFYPELKSFSCGTVVGGTGNLKFDIKTQLELQKTQKEVVQAFRDGTCNLIVSTSVLEEGIDVRHCNVVVRFDEPATFRSYVQSLGRARALPSYAIIMTYKDSSLEMRNTLAVYKKIHIVLTRLCHDRELPSQQDVCQSHSNDVDDPDFAPFGIPGPQITANSAVQLLNRYCGKLPSDKFTQLVIDVKQRQEGEKCYVDLGLPMSAPVHITVSSNPKSSFEDGKRSAALKMCIALFRKGQFNADLLPKEVSDVTLEKFSSYVAVPDEVVQKGSPQPGTRGRCQLYERKVCDAFKKCATNSFFLYAVDFTHLVERQSEFKMASVLNGVGFMCMKKLSCCNIPLYSNKWGQVNVSVEFMTELGCSEKEIRILYAFHRHMVTLLHSFKDEEICPSENELLFIVPLRPDRGLDFDFIQSYENCVSRTGFVSIGMPLRQSGPKKATPPFEFVADDYADKALFPLYRNSELFFVLDIDYRMNPLSPFTKIPRYGSYKDFYEKSYNALITNNTQPLLECKHLSMEFNYLVEKSGKSKSDKSGHPVLVPELCFCLPGSVTFWSQMLCLPSILHRINGLQIEKQLFSLIDVDASNRSDAMFDQSVLTFNWLGDALDQRSKSCSNLALNLRNVFEGAMLIYPGMILQALTPINANDNFNLERLELIGDSYLKYYVGLYLFCKEKELHEGCLTELRSIITSNKTLYLCAKRCGLTSMYQGAKFCRETASFYGSRLSKEGEESCRERHEQLEEGEVCEDDSPWYNQWTHQVVRDKCAADCVEALIGVYLVCGGEGAAQSLLRWLHFQFARETVKIPTKAIVEGKSNSRDDDDKVLFLYELFGLARLEKELGYVFNEKSFVVEAVTHPSCISNKVTQSYQRLEFLGDAILDYLVTCHVFPRKRNHTPGQLTDIRSYLVNNATLAQVCVRFQLQRFLQHAAPALTASVSEYMQSLNKAPDNDDQLLTASNVNFAQDINVPKALGDLVESLIGAVYLDSGQSWQPTWTLISKLLSEELKHVETSTPINCVRELYEMRGDVHMDHFSPGIKCDLAQCTITISGLELLHGRGKNKRSAQQAAAKLALSRLKQKK